MAYPPHRVRKALGLTRAEFARALNVTERTVARWEDGTTPQGLAAEIFRGLDLALTTPGANHKLIAEILRAGVGTLLRIALSSPNTFHAHTKGTS